MAEARKLTLTDKAFYEQRLAALEKDKMDVAHEIKVAREQGDLSENAEYSAARDRQAHIQGELEEIEELLKTSIFVDDANISVDSVNVGQTITVMSDYHDGEAEEEVFHLLGSTQLDPENNKITTESPIGATLMGAHVGDTVEVKTPGGIVSMTVMKIERYMGQ